MKILHSQSGESTLTLDTLDFTHNSQFRHYTLEFMHITWIAGQAADAHDVGWIEVRLPTQTNWTRLNSTHYNTSSGEASGEFGYMSSFSWHSYQDWEHAASLSNSLWKRERFDLDQLFLGVATENQKLLVRFHLAQRTQANPTGEAWYIDDLLVRASPQPITTPTLSMISFPDHLNYPNSRGAKVVADVTTPVTQGINDDSVYIAYRVGNSPVEQRAYMHRQGTSNRFIGRIPMYGYDTLIHYHVIAKDATTNSNTVYFPKNSSQWRTYRCVRGRTNTSSAVFGTISNTAIFPFPNMADNRSEWIYDSVTMDYMGYGPGYINSFRFILTTSPITVTRPRLQIRMMNAPSSEPRTPTMTAFTKTEMQIVYDSSFTIEQAAAGGYKMVTLQDTFYYAGSDLVMQVLYDGNTDPAANSVRHVSTSSNKSSLYSTGSEASYGYNIFGPDIDQFALGVTVATRPWMQFYETQNVPLIYDCGISAMSYPNYDTPCNIGLDSVVVWLKNYGVSPMNAVRIWYRIDNGNYTHYDWTGTLNGGDSVRVHVCDSQLFTVGYHTIRAWVDDTITIDTLRMRDHEPYNDTVFTPFAACDGPYNGVRIVGTGASANFSSLENCLYVLSRCGVNGPLTIKLPGGIYDITKFPYIPGASDSNYVLFEPATASAQVTFRRARTGVNTNVPALVDMTEARGIRFNNIKFSNGRYSDNRCDVLAQLGDNSANCQFINCSFSDSNSINNSAQSLINTGNADSTLVTNCTFYGGTIGVDITGAAPDVRSVGNRVYQCTFTNQINSAIRIVNQSAAIIDSNFANDVLTNASYIILGQYCYDGTQITRNKVYSSKGTCCIGVSDMHGSNGNYCIVANNMLVSVDDGTSNMLTTPLNIIKGSYIKTVFNSVRMNAPTRVNVAAATFGGDVISHSYFQNNVIATFDTSNYAFSFIPGDSIANLHVNHNCYYSVSGVLNKLSGTNYNNLNGWRNAVPSDIGSVSGNPNYTNGSVSRVDLRSFNALLRNVGVPIPEVTIDLFGSTRSTTAPSLGAYEVTALSVDFTPEEFVTPMEDYCGAPASIPVEVAIRNMGNGTYTASTASPMTVYYSIDNGPVQSFVVNRDCGPNDTIHFLSTRTMSLPSGTGNTDRTYNIKWWVKCNLDPDDLNDTSTWSVLSRYAAPAPTAINQTINYNTVATITPTAGVNTWPVSYYTSGNGRQQRSGISWYHSMTDTAAFFYGPTLTTTPLYDDTTFYISQKRNLPLVKITEVQVNRTAAGATYPMPSWMNAQTAFAVELTNCGDYPANLEGDSVLVVQSNSAAKIWVLPNVTIQPGATLVLQYRTNSTASDSSRTIYAPSTATVTPAYTANFGVIYRDGHGVADAVAFNGVITTTSSQAINWSNQHIPAAVWQGSAIDLARNGGTTNTPTAGARRIAWPTNATNASPTATASLWQVATDSLRMHLGETENNLIRYFDNGCEGFRSAVNIHVTNVPNTDLFVDEPVVDTGCNLTTAEPVSVMVHNYGSNAVPTVVVKYSLDGGTTIMCSDTIASGIGIRSGVYHTFSTPINMQTNHDTVFNIKVWVDAVTGDNDHTNDTNTGSFNANYTPSIPLVDTVQTVSYGERLTITADSLPTTDNTIWYDINMNVLDITPGSYTTNYIYRRDTMFVRAVALKDVANTHIGTLASVMSNSYPSPYNPKQRYVKEQYLITAQQLQAAGHGAGTISSLSFYLESLGNNVTSFTFDYYTIKMGTTTASTFANGTFVTGLTQVYNKSNYTFTSANIGWVKHTLDSQYQWDGTSNIVIEITRALSAAGPTNGANTRYTAQANTVISKQHATTDQASQTSGTKGNNRPDILFGFLEPVGCESPASPIYINVTNIPDNDASIQWPVELDTTVIASCDTTNLNVVLENRGNYDISNYTLRYKIDNGSWQQITGNANNLPLGYSRTVPLLSSHFTPGRHTVTAVVIITGDTVPTNDTIIRTFNVRFCAGTYSIGSCGSDYPSMTTALDTLHNAGVAGPIVFELCEQTFTEQLDFGPIDGTDATNTVTFKTVPGATDMATIFHTPTNASNYVINISGASHIIFDSITFYANYTTGSGNNIFANVAKVEESNFITFYNCVLRSKKTTASSTNANVLLLGDNNHYITVNNCLLDSGYYSVRSSNNTSSDNISIINSDILNFWYQGVYLRNTDTIAVTGDSIASGVTVAGKPLTGIYIAGAYHASIQRNYIHLIDSRTGGKRGIALYNCRGTNIDRVTVYNNMVSLYGTAVASLSSSGIWIDSLSKHVSVYYNTCNLYAGVNQNATRTFSCQNSSYIHALNNIFKNESKGFAYYVAIDTCMASSNYNVYWTNADTHATTGVIKFAFWGVNCNNLDSLRLLNHTDNNSYQSYPYFVDSIYNLSTLLAQYADRAQYNPDVITDIRGCIRPQIPKPTIGAYEFNCIRETHDVAVAEIIEPYVPSVTTGNNPIVLNIETDSIMVRVRFFNNGTAIESNLTWYAYMADTYPVVQSEIRQINRLASQAFVEDSVLLESPLGIVDTQDIVVVINMAPGIVDQRPEDNIDTAQAFIYPAYDLQVISVAVDSTCDPAHCRMYSVPLKYTLKNAGKKDFPGDFPFTLGYDYYCHQPSTQSFPNFPGSSSLDVQTFAGTALPVGTQREVSLTPTYEPNLYPTGTLLDITARLRGFVTAQYDIKQHNDTTSYINITSNHTPDAPIAHDTMVDYGTYGNLWATQGETRVIRWTRDTTDGSFFYNGNNNYNRSTHWSDTPQYFHDSLYYLYCLSSRNCTSYYSQINVGINMPLSYDVSISEVRSPRGSGRVYLERDTVTLRVVNYGSQPISNIPIAFKFMNANGRTTYLEVHDTVRHTIPGRVGDNVQYYDHTFGGCLDDTAMLLINQIVSNSALTNNTFTLNAWVYHPDDMQRGNDTLRTVHTFRTLAENCYDSINKYAPTSPEGFNITHVSYNELDNHMPDLIPYDNLWLGSYNPTNAEVPTLYVLRGTQDTLTIEVANYFDEFDSTTAASLCVAIDYNRDGQYDFLSSENITRRAGIGNAIKVHSRRPYKIPLTIPESAHYGYMRMLVWVHGDSTLITNGIHTATSFDDGQMQQYLLYVQEECMLDSVDAALTRVVAPRENVIVDSNYQVIIMLANKGSKPLTQASISYRFHNVNQPNPFIQDTMLWSGELEPGMSTPVTLCNVHFPEGTTNLFCSVIAEGDTFHVTNNTLQYQYHRYYVVVARFIDSFDQPIDKWYAPVGYNNFTRNYFERGMPSKSIISSAYSQPNAYITSATESIVTGKHGNRSVLYSPIINIQQIRTDTITFLINKNMAEGSFLRLEYLDYQGLWQLVEDPSVRWVAGDASGSWYDTEQGWTGSTAGAYNTLIFPTSLISGEFTQRVQFRFVFTTPVSTSPAANFGDGVAIDNLVIGRQRRAIDVGVREITYPTNPQFGQTIYPRVRIHNYGTDSIRNFIVCYRPFGTYLAHEATCTEWIPAGGDFEFEFPTPFIITSQFPDTFEICAFTKVQSDYYRDNDTTCNLFGLSPLANDLYLYAITSPLASAVAGDSINITVRLRNFGQNEIEDCTVRYLYNENDTVTEHIVFSDYLGRNLGSTEFFNYTFRHRERATMGTMRLTAWCEYRQDVYPYNDTIFKEIAGIAAITDIQATASMVDQRNDREIHICAILDNVGARAANNFTVGYYIDNDPSTRFEETFHRDLPFASGDHAVHRFSNVEPWRSYEWAYVTVYCSVPGDTNQRNDTSRIIQPYSTDLELVKLQVEENMSDSCRIRAVVRSNGNILFYNTFWFQPTIINDISIPRYQYPTNTYYFEPGDTRHVLFKTKIPKSPTRTYIGSSRLNLPNADDNPANDQTTIIEVVNYFEDVPRVAEPEFVLEQNYPNPYDGTTRIEFALPYGGSARFFVTDVVGRLVHEETTYYDEGRHTISFNKGKLPSGVYYYGLEFNGQRRMHKMIIH